MERNRFYAKSIYDVKYHYFYGKLTSFLFKGGLLAFKEALGNFTLK
jgi:hypothetical protein